MHEKHSMKEIKLYLRPMSDLAREITHRGETVVPIVAIGNLIGYENLTAYEFDGRVEYGWGRQCYDDSQGYSFGWHTASMAFGVWADCIDEGWPTVQTEMMTVHVIDWLNAHFFDYRGLIDAGLAIDVNTLPENPYEK